MTQLLRRDYWDRYTKALRECEIHTSVVAARAVITVAIGEDHTTHTFAGIDFEDSLQQLRRHCEAHGRLLLINRFRRDGFASSLSRQMSSGLSCYLVELGRPVDPARIVRSLDPADVRSVVTAAEASKFIERWKSPPLWCRGMAWLRQLGKPFR